MERTELCAYLLSKPGTTEERPFGPDTAVFKVRGKMFALVPDNKPLRINLKCDPNEALFLRDMFTAVQPGYHMNKRHWNTVTCDDSIPADIFWRMVDDSYDLVVKTLSKVDRTALQHEKN